MDDFLERVEQWLAERNRSIPMLSRLSNVSQPSIRRALSRECVISDQNGLKITDVIARDFQDKIQILKDNFPNLLVISPSENDTNNPPGSLPYFLRSEEIFKMFVWMAKKKVTNKSTILSKHGDKGIDIANDLVENDCAEVILDGYRSIVPTITCSEHISVASELNTRIIRQPNVKRRRQYALFGTVSEEKMHQVESLMDQIAELMTDDSDKHENTSFIFNTNLTWIDNDD
ncbi:MAG: hypothetical protein HRU19_28945 [Pseudobacteriovorax sp.]|nr:hypothetical protein [Pseudobacteriovorax sp.]